MNNVTYWHEKLGPICALQIIGTKLPRYQFHLFDIQTTTKNHAQNNLIPPKPDNQCVIHPSISPKHAPAATSATKCLPSNTLESRYWCVQLPNQKPPWETVPYSLTQFLNRSSCKISLTFSKQKLRHKEDSRGVSAG
jgi:hypothetical protein